MCFWRLHLFFNKNYLRCLPLHKVLTIKKIIHETKVKNLTLKSRQFFLNNVFLKNIRDPSVAILKTFDYSSRYLAGKQIISKIFVFLYSELLDFWLKNKLRKSTLYGKQEIQADKMIIFKEYFDHWSKTLSQLTRMIVNIKV